VSAAIAHDVGDPVGDASRSPGRLGQPVPRVIPGCAAGVSPIRRPEAGERGHYDDPPLSATLAASRSMSAEASIARRPSRSH
jgi:hypothetical protein